MPSLQEFIKQAEKDIKLAELQATAKKVGQGRTVRETLGAAAGPTPTFKGLPKPGGAVGETERIGGLPFFATPDVPVPREVKQAATQIPAFAVGGPIGAMGAEFGRQKLSGEETSLMDVGLAGLGPGVSKIAGGIGKSLLRAGGALVAPGATRAAGMQAVKKFGRSIPKFRFLSTMADTPPASVLFAQADAAGPIPTTPFRNAIEKAFLKEAGMSTPNKKALTVLSNLEKKLGASDTLDSADLIDELSRLRRMATANFRGTGTADPVLGDTLEKAAKTMIDNAPAQYKQALKAWRRQTSLADLLDEVGKSDVATAVDKLLRNNPVVKGAFTDLELTEITKVAKAMSRISTGVNVGVGNRVFNFFAEPIVTALETKPGRGLLLTLMSDPDMTAGRFAAAMGTLLGIAAGDVQRAISGSN